MPSSGNFLLPPTAVQPYQPQSLHSPTEEQKLEFFRHLKSTMTSFKRSASPSDASDDNDDVDDELVDVQGLDLGGDAGAGDDTRGDGPGFRSGRQRNAFIPPSSSIINYDVTARRDINSYDVTTCHDNPSPANRICRRVDESARRCVLSPNNQRRAYNHDFLDGSKLRSGFRNCSDDDEFSDDVKRTPRHRYGSDDAIHDGDDNDDDRVARLRTFSSDDDDDDRGGGGEMCDVEESLGGEGRDAAGGSKDIGQSGDKPNLVKPPYSYIALITMAVLQVRFIFY